MLNNQSPQEFDLIQFNSIAKVDNNLMEYVEATGDILRNLPVYFTNASLPVQQKIVSSICASKLVVDENGCRTPEYNEVIQWICKLDTVCDDIKTGQAGEFTSLSEGVIPLGLEPRTPTLKVLCSTN